MKARQFDHCLYSEYFDTPLTLCMYMYIVYIAKIIVNSVYYFGK